MPLSLSNTEMDALMRDEIAKQLGINEMKNYRQTGSCSWSTIVNDKEGKARRVVVKIAVTRYNENETAMELIEKEIAINAARQLKSEERRKHNEARAKHVAKRLELNQKRILESKKKRELYNEIAIHA